MRTIIAAIIVAILGVGALAHDAIGATLLDPAPIPHPSGCKKAHGKPRCGKVRYVPYEYVTDSILSIEYGDDSLLVTVPVTCYVPVGRPRTCIGIFPDGPFSGMKCWPLTDVRGQVCIIGRVSGLAVDPPL